MTEPEAKNHLVQILHSFTIGSVLHLLSELFHESTQPDETARTQAEEVAATLFVVGLGVDAAYPRRFQS